MVEISFFFGKFGKNNKIFGKNFRLWRNFDLRIYLLKR